MKPRRLRRPEAKRNGDVGAWWYRRYLRTISRGRFGDYVLVAGPRR